MFKRLLLFLILLTSATPALAELSQEQAEHARSAFYFAERKNWDDAKLHAERSEQTGLLALIDWLYALDPDSGASTQTIREFLRDHPDWPEDKRLRVRAETAIANSGLENAEIIAWLLQEPPITGAGKIALAEATEDEKTRHALVREGWIQGDFDEVEHARLLEKYGDLLTKEDHTARIDRLLWEGKAPPAEWLLSKVSGPHRALFNARIALIRGKKPAAIPASNDAGLLYERMRHYAAKNNDKKVRELLLAAPGPLPYPEKWWDYRERQVREAIDEGHYKLAARLLAGHGLSEGSDFADAIWLEGWLNLEFLKEPKKAYALFYRMHDAVRFPVSKARAAYWAARAAETSGDTNAAAQWLATAASYPTAFYGQLAALKRHGNAPLRLPAEHSAAFGTQGSFDQRPMTQAIKISAAMDQDSLASRLLSGFIEKTDDDDAAVMAAHIGKDIGVPYLSVRGAKKVMQYHHIVLAKAGYPTPATPYDAAVERALLLAVTRQESEFDPQAKSPAGALGMAQLLPSTARETARKNGLDFSLALLREPEANWRLGALYLDRLINSYDGSYILAIAAYNAGPGNVRKWIAKIGTPGGSVEDAVNWTEKIPFAETRNYVQRVLENLQVYRHLLADGETPKLRLDEDLRR